MDVRREDRDGVAVLTMDDGGRNALDVAAFEAVAGAFDDLGDDVAAVVLTGREGVFSAGLDLKYIQSTDRAGMHRLLTVFGRTLMRVWTEPRPVVAAVTGHAVAAGTMLSMAADHAVAAEGDFRWGLTETRIDFEMPMFGVELARGNVRNDRIDDLLLPGAILAPAAAVEVGYADELAPPASVLDRAVEHARELAQLPAHAYAGTKRRLRGEAAGRVLDGLEADLEALLRRFPDRAT